MTSTPPLSTLPPIDGLPVTEGAQTPVESASTHLRQGLGWIEYGSVALVSVAMSIVVCGVWWAFGPARSEAFGVVDVPGIVELEELVLSSSMMQATVTDADRAKAYERVKGFGPSLEAAVDQVRKHCRCVLLTRGAYVGAVDNDYTQEVKRLVGLDKVDAATLREAVTKNVGAMPDNFKK